MKNNKEYLNKIVNIIEKPYFYEMENYGIVDLNEQKYVLSIVFGVRTQIHPLNGSNRIRGYEVFNLQYQKYYQETFNGSWSRWEYDTNGQVIYYQESGDEWYKKEYDSNGNRVYYEDSEGFWCKTEFDKNGNRIYYETSEGYIEDYRKYL